MSTRIISTPAVEINPASSYRLYGSCSIRTYVALDDTPYAEEKIITHTTPNAHPERAATVQALVRALGATRWPHVSAAALALIDANPNATVAELTAMLNQ